MKPTKEQLRKCFEVSQSRPDEFIVGAIYRRISIKITALVARVNIRPEAIVIISFLVGLLGAAGIATALRTYMIVGGFLIIIGQILDSVDGEIARLKGMMTKKGGWLDACIDRIIEIPLIFALAWCLFQQTGNYNAFILGFFAYASIAMTNLITMYTGTKLEKTELRETHSDFFFVKILKKLGIKQEYISLGVGTQTLIMALGGIFNLVGLALWFFVVVQNIYWISIFLLVALRKGSEEISNKAKKK